MVFNLKLFGPIAAMIIIIAQPGAFAQIGTPDSIPANPGANDTAQAFVSDTSPTQDSAVTDSLPHNNAQAIDSIAIEGMALDSVTGEFPENKDLAVYLDSIKIQLDSTGNFIGKAPRAKSYQLSIYSAHRMLFTRSIPDDPEKPNIFITCMITTLSQKKQAVVDSKGRLTDGVPWVVSGCIIDSRLDLVITVPGARLTFDDSLLNLSAKGSFTVSTKRSGVHAFHCRIPGYHEVYESIALTESDKQPFVTIATTELKNTLKRREITVSAKRQPVHATATVAKVKIERRQLLRITGTVNDPIRALATLPGVASESDLSAVPIIRGGDLLESRVFLDGITLLQPYHFGGIKSMFNTAAVENLTLYKSGFPAEYHNAQSGLIVVESRSPARDSATVSGDINFLQYNMYAGIPLKNNTVGLNFSSQGSYNDFMYKRALDIASTSKSTAGTNFEQLKKQVNLPDYQDFSGGVEWRPSDKLRFSINQLYNTDRAIFTNKDSIVPVTYYYNHVYHNDAPYDTSLFNKYLPYQEFYSDTIGLSRIKDYLHDTSFSITNENSYNYYNPGTYYYYNISPDDVRVGKKRYIYDTNLVYKSFYSILHANSQYQRTPDQIFSLSLAWQQRWWELNFPAAMSNIIDTSRFDVDIGMWNVNGGMLYSGRRDHIVKCGFQWDITKERYNVYLVRLLHEFITKGSTNVGDYWGPVTGDSGSSSTSSSAYTNDLMDRLLVSYKGNKLFHTICTYGEDEWTLTPRLTLNYGARIESSTADNAITVSPRVSAKYNLREKHEIIGALGLYTQNNYDAAAIALSEHLKPEKVWHASTGLESKLLPWLSQKIDLYGKYYYDLTSEDIRPTTTLTPETLDSLQLAAAYEWLKYNYNYYLDFDSIMTADPDKAMQLLWNYINETSTLRSTFSNEGKGWSAGGEYMLRFDPADFWDGWISVSYGKSMRQRHPGWRWHEFPFDRPLLISIVNYYRLPRKFEVGLKYRYMTGIPYTPMSYDDEFKIGAYNSRRYAPYQALDMRIAKGFTIKGSKCHFYIEALNMLNIPNLFLNDSKTHELQMVGMNLPFPMLHIGFDINNF
jgi:hypothetical protein